jgi:hypothetical protein
LIILNQISQIFFSSPFRLVTGNVGQSLHAGHFADKSEKLSQVCLYFPLDFRVIEFDTRAVDVSLENYISDHHAF